MISKKAKLSSKILSADLEAVPTRNGYGEALVELGKENPNVVVLSGDLAESTRAQAFADAYPERFFEVGIAEQNMMGVAAGLALSGKIPFTSSYATFSPGRSWDQLRVSVCYSRANVKVVGSHAGLSVGPDGATHQALEDIAITRVLPNITVVVPADYYEARKATLAIAEHVGSSYLRLSRSETPVFTTEKTSFELGKAYVLREGTDVTFVGCGPILYEALLAAEELSTQGIEVQVINSHTVKPLDAKTILNSAKKTGAIVTLEEHQIAGGLGSAVAELLAQEYPVPIEMIGINDSFGESGEPAELWLKYNLTSAAIQQKALRVIQRKTK